MFLHVIFYSDDSLDLEVKYVSLINDSEGSRLYFERLFDNPEEGDFFPISDVFYFSITTQEDES